MKKLNFLALCLPVKTSETVMREIAKQNHIEELVVRGHCHLQSLNPDSLSACINGMSKVQLIKTKLSKEQIDVLFNDMNRETSLSELDIRENDLSKVDPVVLSKCVNNLKKVNLTKTNLSRDQLDSIMTQMKKKTSLEHLNVSQNNCPRYFKWEIPGVKVICHAMLGFVWTS